MNVIKSDLLRYVVLYEYGGLYADLDTLDIRPLDRVTQRFSCTLYLDTVSMGAFCLSNTTLLSRKWGNVLPT